MYNVVFSLILDSSWLHKLEQKDTQKLSTNHICFQCISFLNTHTHFGIASQSIYAIVIGIDGLYKSHVREKETAKLTSGQILNNALFFTSNLARIITAKQQTLPSIYQEK